MKELIIPALILALILSGCSFTEQLETVKTEYIDPAVEAAKNGESTRTDAEPEVQRAQRRDQPGEADRSSPSTLSTPGRRTNS